MTQEDLLLPMQRVRMSLKSMNTRQIWYALNLHNALADNVAHRQSVRRIFWHPESFYTSIAPQLITNFNRRVCEICVTIFTVNYVWYRNAACGLHSLFDSWSRWQEVYSFVFRLNVLNVTAFIGIDFEYFQLISTIKNNHSMSSVITI